MTDDCSCESSVGRILVWVASSFRNESFLVTGNKRDSATYPRNNRKLPTFIKGNKMSRRCIIGKTATFTKQSMSKTEHQKQGQLACSTSDQVPALQNKNKKEACTWPQTELEADKPPLHGLVLAGGRSVRMGEDKGALDYHGLPQWKRTAQLLAPFCESVYISCRPDQTEDVHPALPDTSSGLGPAGGILSAFQQNSEVAWLVLACDLPLMDEATLQELVAARDIRRIATAFLSPDGGFPEPLIAIWEPRSYSVLLQFLGQGYSSPRRMLNHMDIKLLQATNPHALRNANTPEDRDIIRQLIGRDGQ